jgi:hypothetical protein
MHYEPLKAGTKIEYKDQGLNEYKNEWSDLPNCMIGRQVCAIRARRPVADTYEVTKYAQAQEGDRIGPFALAVEASRFAYQIRKTHNTHEEFAREGVYLVVNRTYKEEV